MVHPGAHSSCLCRYSAGGEVTQKAPRTYGQTCSACSPRDSKHLFYIQLPWYHQHGLGLALNKGIQQAINLILKKGGASLLPLFYPLNPRYH